MNENDLQFECILKEKNDAAIVMSWRNDPATLAMSLTYVEPKTIEQFYPQFLKTHFSMADLPSLFVLYKGERVAVLRFEPAIHPEDPKKKCSEISIVIAPEWRHQGLGPVILKKALAWCKQQGYDSIFAQIKKQNLPSISIFKKAGFAFVRSSFHGQEEILEFVHDGKRQEFGNALVIAEAGSNWKAGSYKEDLARAYALIDAAKEAGADVVKFQVFRANTTYVAEAGKSDYLSFAGIDANIFDLFKDLEMPSDMIPLLAEKCKAVGIQFMASTFSPADVALIDPYVTMHKMGSAEISHLRLIEAFAATGKPLIISTGASMPEDIDWAVDTFYASGGKKLYLLQCTAKYPAPASTIHLRVIPWLRKRYDIPVGLSDHSLGIHAPFAAVALGATIIEKHFTLNKQFNGPDHTYALDPDELKAMIAGIREIEEMLGSSVKKVYEEEDELYLFIRRGIQALKDIHPGELLKEGVNMAILRPGKQMKGLHPKFIEQIEGRAARHFIAAGAGIQWLDFKEG